MKEKAFGYIDEHRDGMMKMWEELVMMDSGSGNKPDVDAIVAKVAGILEGMGGKTRIIEHENAGNMLVSEFGDCKTRPLRLQNQAFYCFNRPSGYCFQRPGNDEEASVYH